MGFDTSDDACVYRISDQLALVQTVDFFPPMVDDPYAFGQIAAANSLSDIYAMGAKPTLAMNLLCYPSCLPLELVREILAGGYSKVLEAGAVIAGGHTIDDDIPKYGLCVSGMVDPRKMWTNSGALEGDALILTKPLGIGILTTAAKADLTTPQQFAPAVESMAALNKAACETASRYQVHACTDVTGFGLLGHAREMAQGSGKSIHLLADSLPVLSGAEEFARMGVIPGGAYANMEYLGSSVHFDSKVEQSTRDLMADPQTSGGLLLSLPQEEASALLDELSSQTEWARLVGYVGEKQEHDVLVE